MNTEQGVAGKAEVGKKNVGANPVVAIAVAICIALVLAGISFVIFLRSDTRRAIDLIQEQTSLENADGSLADTPDETSLLTKEDLEGIEEGILTSISEVSADEFSSSELTDAALGL